MKQQIHVGVVCLARHTFDSAAAAEIYRGIQEALRSIEDTHFVFEEQLVVEIGDARAAGERLSRLGLDGLVCVSGTFHLGHLALELVRAVGRPCLLWAPNELPYDGGKIRLNSVCGLNLDASNLYKAGFRNFHTVLGDQIDTDWLDALRVQRCWREARVGNAGHHAHGFFNLSFYEPTAFRELGVLVDHHELEAIWSLPVPPESVAEERRRLRETFALGAVTEPQADAVALLAARLEAFLSREGLSALAIRCWPEFAAKFGIAPCAAMSLLQARGRVLACEGDVEGALSMLAHRSVGGTSPYLFDFSQVNLEQDFALLWHCGVAPADLWDGRSVRSLDPYFAAGKGVTADFVLRPGPISILRLDSSGEERRLFVARAEGLPTEKELKGTYLKARFDQPVRTVLDSLIQNGVAHHASMVYGDFVRPFEILARIQGFRLIKP